MAVTSEQILGFLNANPGISDAEIVAAMEQYGVSPAQMAQAVGVSEGEVAARVAATVPQGQTITLGDTIIAPEYRVIGSGEDQQIGNLETIYTSKTTGDPNYRAPVGSEYQQYNADGTFQRTGVTQEVNATKDFLKFAAGAGLLFGGLGGGFESLFGGGGAATGNGAFLGEGVLSGVPSFDAALANSTIGGTGFTLSQLTQFDRSLGGSGGTLGALTLAEQLGGLAAGTLTAGLLTSGGTPVVPTGGTPVPPVVPPTGIPPVVPPVVPPTTIPPVIPPLVKSVIPAAVSGLLTPTNVGKLLTTGATTTAGLLQQQTSREAAQKAQAMIDRETTLAKQSAAFRPVGMTTRFGTSQFQVDPVTGQLTSAGYTLSPEAKNAQDRLVTLAGQGLTQAEGAQQAFAPLQTGAQNLFGLGNKYIAQSPEDVAKNYLSSQMALLQPSRELELANLQNRLQQQGRGGLAVAQGGALGATTPELQALFNARAQQEAQLAAQAQQAGQQQVLYGAGLLGQGTTAMGNYYAGQQGAYAPYTTAMGQVTGLEALGQQPLNMSTALAQQTSQAGANVGRLGLSGAEFSTRLATGPAATTNPYSTLLGGVGSSNAFGTAAGSILGSLFGTTPVNALSSTAYGPGNAGFQNMLNDIYG